MMKMRWARALAAACAALLVAGCAATGQDAATTLLIGGETYRVTYTGNTRTSRETAQTYWLYRAANLALEQGFDGFEILTPLTLGLATTPRPQPQDGQATTRKVLFLIVPISPFMGDHRTPYFEADIKLVKGPVAANPPKVFDARELKKALEPLVAADRSCDRGNVCPHIKDYLQPRRDAEAAQPRAAGA